MRIKGKQIREWWGLFRIYYSRGNHLVNFIIDMVQLIGFLGMIIIYFDNYLGVTIPSWVIYAMPFVPLFFCILAYGDKRRGTWLFETEYSMKFLNPVMAKLVEDVKDIKEKVNEKNK